MKIYRGGQSQSVTAPDGYPEVGLHATKTRAKRRPKLSTKRRLTENERISSSPRAQSLAYHQARQVARYDLTPTHSRYEEPMETLNGAITAHAGETLAAFVNRGGVGRHAVTVDATERLIVDTPSAGVSSRAVTLDWLRIAGDPLMRRVQLVTIDTATGLAYAGDSVLAEYLVGGAGSSAAADPTVAFKKLEPKHIGTRPIEVTRNVLAVAPDAEEWLTEGIMRSIRRTIIKELLVGSGATGHAQGVYGATDVEVMPTPGALSSLNFNKIEALRALAVENSIEDSAGDLFVLSAAVAAKLSATAKQNNNAPRLLERGRPGPDGAPYSEIPGLGEAYRNADLTANVAIYGNWENVVVGVWGGIFANDSGMYVIINPYSANEPNVKLTAYLAFDVAILRPDRFSTALYT